MQTQAESSVVVYSSWLIEGNKGCWQSFPNRTTEGWRHVQEFSWAGGTGLFDTAEN